MQSFLEQPRSLKKIGAILAILVVGAFLLFALYPFRGAILGSIILFTLFRPLQKLLTRRYKFPKKLAAAIVMVVTAVSVILPLTLAIFVISNQVSLFLSNPQQFNLGSIASFVTSDEVIFGNLKAKDVFSRIDLPNLLGNLAQILQTWLVGILGSLTDTFLQILIMYFFLFYLLINLDRLNDFMYNVSPFNRENTHRLMLQFRNMTYANVVGTGINALILGGVLSLGLTIFGVPNAIFWGFMGVIASFIPVVGNSIIWLPISIYMFATGNIGAGIGILIWGGIVLAVLDSFDRTLINSKLGDTHPIISLLGIFVGLPFFGLLGIVIGPMILSYFFLLVKMYKEEYIAKEENM